MAEAVISIAGELAEKLISSSILHLGYLIRHRYYFDLLRPEVEQLRAQWVDVQITVEEARRRGDEIRPIVEGWLDRVDGITTETEELMRTEDEYNWGRRNRWCPNLNSRYRLSRKAHRMRRSITKIAMDGIFQDGVSYRVPSRNIILKNYEHWESRASTFDKIMDALRDDDKIQRIGVWGMGGVGKTTLVKQVAEQAWQEKLFATEVYIDMFFARYSSIEQAIDKIQEQIAYATGLKFEGMDKSMRAAKLMQRLKRERILIILDDVWNEIDLKEAGIPSGDGERNCKILLVSRNLHLLCKHMGTQIYFPVKHLLLEEEAWRLCKKQAGDYLEENLELRGISREVVKECEGLPIAIVTISKALKGESMAIWENALDELRRSSPQPTNIRGMDDKVYSSLKRSYDYLEYEEVKLLFLLCGMLGPGNISMDELLKYVMDSDLFERESSLEQATNRLEGLVKILKDSSLLLDIEDQNKFVRMHRVVCAVARAIAPQHRHWYLLKKTLQSGDGDGNGQIQ